MPPRRNASKQSPKQQAKSGVWKRRALALIGVGVIAAGVGLKTLHERPVSPPRTPVVQQMVTTEGAAPVLRYDLKPQIDFALKKPYVRILAAVQEDLHELKQIGSKQKITSAEESRIPVLVNNIGEKVWQKMSEEYLAHTKEVSPSNIELHVESFEKKFGHLPGAWYPDIGVNGNCFANAVAQNVVFSVLGKNKVGLLWGPTHGAPTIQVRGKTYVIDPPVFFLGKAPTIPSYVKELEKAYKNADHPSHNMTSFVFGAPYGPEVFRYAQHLRGTKPALAGLHTEHGRRVFQFYGALEEAEKQFKQAIQIQPNRFLAYTELGNIYFAQGNFPEAIRQLEKSLAVNPANPLGHAGLANVYMAQKNNSKALYHIRKALEFGHPQPDVLKSFISELEKK